MADYIPFVNSESDCAALKKHYGDARIVRLSLESIDRLKAKLPAHVGLWIDPAVDAYHHIWSNRWPTDIRTHSVTHIKQNWPVDKDGKKEDEWKFKLWQRWQRQFNRFQGYRTLAFDTCWQKKLEHDINAFVAGVLGECLRHNPKWITVPQLPLGKGRSRVNRRLAQATGIWREQESDYRGVRLILPLIMTTTSSLNAKPSRDKILRLACERYTAAKADGVWVVDTSLNDQARNEKFPARYEKLIQFHRNLKRSLPPRATTIGGPYWGVNLVLWARGLCDFPAISLGTTYTYHISGGPTSQGSIRLAIPPLRRWAVANSDLADWLDNALKKLNPSDIAHSQLSRLRRSLTTSPVKSVASNQVARFYKEWFTAICAVSPPGRALALYQDLSSAFVLGRQLPPLPKTALPSAPSKVLEAGKVAEQLMLHCL